MAIELLENLWLELMKVKCSWCTFSANRASLYLLSIHVQFCYIFDESFKSGRDNCRKVFIYDGFSSHLPSLFVTSLISYTLKDNYHCFKS